MMETGLVGRQSELFLGTLNHYLWVQWVSLPFWVPSKQEMGPHFQLGLVRVDMPCRGASSPALRGRIPSYRRGRRIVDST
jgi:hypothetical protein